MMSKLIDRLQIIAEAQTPCGQTSSTKSAHCLLCQEKAEELIEELQALISAESRRAREEAKFKYEPDIAWAIGYGRGIGTPLEYLEKRYPHLLEAELKPKSKSTKGKS